MSYGPHRANIEYLLNKRNESFLSRGEQKKMSIVFWMLQVLILVQNKTKPIVLIDDVSSELDQSKIKSIIDYLTEINITSPTGAREILLQTNQNPIKTLLQSI